MRNLTGNPTATEATPSDVAEIATPASTRTPALPRRQQEANDVELLLLLSYPADFARPRRGEL